MPPASPASQETPSVYTFTTANSNQFVSTAQSNSAPNSWRFASTLAGGYGNFNLIYDACDPDYSALSFWLYLPALPAASNYENFILSGNAGAAHGATNSYGFRIGSTGVVEFYVDGAAAENQNNNVATISTGVWTDFVLSGFDADCDGVPSATLSSATLEFVVSLAADAFSNGQTIDDFSITHSGSTANTLYVDDIEVSGVAPPGSASFCADQNVLDYNGVAEADYGYDYRRGGDYFDQEDGNVNGIGLSTGFDYTATTEAESGWDYSAKHLSTGSKALHENITIEAGTDGNEATFRVNFHTQVGSDADATAKGNGLTTGHFADHLEAQFQENGNAWQITFWYVNAGGARTQMGSSINFGDSNDATQFTVWLDTRSTANIISTLDDAFPGDYYYSGAIHADPFIAVTTASASDGPTGEQNFLFPPRYLDDISGNPFLDDTVGDIWNVGSGTLGLGAAAWHLALDENNQENRANTGDEGGHASTCIFDDAGTAVFANSQGGTPANIVAPPQDPGAEEGTTTTGIGDIPTVYVLFLGIVVVAAFAASMAEGLKGGAATVGIFAVLGLVIVYALGFVQLWVLVVLGVIGVAAIFLGFFRKGSAA